MDAPPIAPTARSNMRWPARRRRAAIEAHAQDSAATVRTLLVRAAVVGAGILGLADILADVAPLHMTSRVVAVLVAGAAALLAAAAVEPADQEYVRRRWQLQAVACAFIMFLLMAGAPGDLAADLLWFTIVVGAAAALVALATAYRQRAITSGASLCLVLDASIVGFTTLLTTLALGGLQVGGAQAALLVGAFAAAGYAVAVATRPTIRLDPYGPDALLLSGVLVLCLYASGVAARQVNLPLPGLLAAPGVALFGALGLARSGWRGLERPTTLPAPTGMPETRLRLIPALAAVGAIAVLSWAELNGEGGRAGFFGIIIVFGLVVARLLVTLLENRQLTQRVERSGVFEENLRDLGGALIAEFDRKDTLELVCRTAQMSLRADSVILWMLDAAADELEAVEVMSAKRTSLLRRRLVMNDPTSVAVRVARTGAAEIVLNAATANHSNAFLNVLLHAQTLLAVPVMRGDAVQGVLVCIDARNPTAYGAAELAKAELLASQVAVALDNAYQHALQRRRLEELSALYQFAQSAHAALSSAEIVRQLLPILKERLGYTYGTIWLREEHTGALRLAAGDGPGGSPRALRPSPLAQRACATVKPARAGLDWDDSGQPMLPPRDVGGSQLAVPMVLQRRVVGVVDLEQRQPQAYSPTEERLLVALANHAALAVENLHLVEETRKVAALRELDRMKTELLGTVSHELRTPLGSIKGYATTLLTHGNRLKRDEQREFLEIIDSEADRLRELIENLLDMSRLEAGVLRIDREPTRLGAIAHDVVRKVELAGANHTLVLDWPAGDPLVAADARRIYQVMQNLLTNAVKYSPEGGTITLAGRAERHDLLVSVQDQGLGMPASELDKIFDRFHRVSGDVARQIGGTGLGLAICKGLVDAHGGRIWAESEGDNKGSAFKFTLPLLPDGQEATGSKGVDDHQEANRSRR
jgi:signal transduction histidine kinase